MRILLPYLLVIGFAVPPTIAQTPAENLNAKEPKAEKKATTDSANEKSDAVPEVNPAFEMLQQAYYSGGPLPADEHAYQMDDLLQTAAKMQHPAIHQWVHELFQLTAGLSEQYMRLVTEQGALSALADVDPAEALHLLAQLTPVAIAWGNRPRVDDIRVTAAQKIFPKYWKGTKAPDIDALRSAANYLGETGQYPYSAMGAVLKDVKAKDPSAAEMILLDAMQYYQRVQSNDLNSHFDFYYLIKLAKGVVPEALERAAVALAVDRLLTEAGKGLPDEWVFVGRVYNGSGFVELGSPAEAILYRMLPLVREVQPELEQRILEARSGFKKTVPSEFGSLPEGYIEDDLTVVGSPTPENKARAIEWLTDNTRVDNALRLADTNPETAIKIAQSISDPARRASTLATIAQGKFAEKDPDQAAKIMEEFGSKSEREKTKDDKTQLALLVTQARTQARRNDAGAWDTLSQGLELAERLFTEGTRASRRIGYRQIPDRPGVWPGYIVTGFEEAIALIKIGAEKETANTLGWLAHEHDPALKSYLLISAAEGLWNKQKANPASASATPSPQQ